MEEADVDDPPAAGTDAAESTGAVPPPPPHPEIPKMNPRTITLYIKLFFITDFMQSSLNVKQFYQVAATLKPNNSARIAQMGYAGFFLQF